MIIEHAILLARATGLSQPLGSAKAIVFPTLPAAKHIASKRHMPSVTSDTISVTGRGVEIPWNAFTVFYFIRFTVHASHYLTAYFRYSASTNVRRAINNPN